jgi:hypothetical protein
MVLMTEQKRIILISEFIETKLRKENELKFYEKELLELQTKIGYLRQEVTLTNTIINIIKHETVIDIAESLQSNDNMLIGKGESSDKKI